MIYKILCSYITTFILLIILAIGSAVGTFLENDFGAIEAKKLVYNSWWFQLTFFLLTINLITVIDKTKMYKVKARFLFHISFIVILFGALITHYFGFEGMMHIREGQSSNVIVIGEEKVLTPFRLELHKFTLTRYPGSRSPSEFSSDLIVLDKSTSFDVTIYMNNTLSYKGYKFFQTSYDDDEKGTKLSVNKDPGMEITYVGYAMLFLGLVLNLFDRKSRFHFLIKQIKKFSAVLIILAISLSINTIQASEYFDTYMLDHKEKSKKLSELFGGLVLQGPMGRMKPVDTQNREVLSKLTRKSSWNGMSANQVILGMFSRPKLWKKARLVYIKTNKLKKILNIKYNDKLARFTDFFDKSGKYKLSKLVDKASKLTPFERGTFERDLIKVDERLNIMFMSFRGVLLTLFPLPNNNRNKWVDFKTMFSLVDNSEIKRATSNLLDACFNRNYQDGITHIKTIKDFQLKYGSRILPTSNSVAAELWFNKVSLFFYLSLAYLVFGLIFFGFSMKSILTHKSTSKSTQSISGYVCTTLFIIHTFGIILRWYISGHAPIANTYETMVYISYSSIIASLFFFRKSLMAISASFLMAGVFIFAAYLGEIDPEITNLVPVLKSYWLSIHVSVITASYGFFGVGAFLGLITLFLFIAKSKDRPHLKYHIKHLTYINEAVLLLGLTLLIIGNFLGGIWANESWGRYWGWDPKETWAFISILVYTLVLHLRLLKKVYTQYLFSVLSVLSFSSILMTYFGVNFYLSGKHSYATGDPVAIPTWVYTLLTIVLLIIVIAFIQNKKNTNKEKL